MLKLSRKSDPNHPSWPAEASEASKTKLQLVFHLFAQTLLTTLSANANMRREYNRWTSPNKIITFRSRTAGVGAPIEQGRGWEAPWVPTTLGTSDLFPRKENVWLLKQQTLSIFKHHLLDFDKNAPIILFQSPNVEWHVRISWVS